MCSLTKREKDETMEKKVTSQYKGDEKLVQHKKHCTRLDQYLLCLLYATLCSLWVIKHEMKNP